MASHSTAYSAVQNTWRSATVGQALYEELTRKTQIERELTRANQLT